MTVITVDHPEIVDKYSSYEIQMKFLEFLHKELGEDQIELFHIGVDDLSVSSKKRLKNIDTLNFVDLQG